MKVRVGIPLTGGKLVAAAREANYPVLFSANAFFVGHPKGHPREGEFKKFKEIDFQQFEGLDAALDSAGFVAMSKYGSYRWSMEDYMDLAQAHPWTWFASMDMCCESEVADDRPLRLLRMAATANNCARLNRIADEREMQRPMPVLQGWTAQEYLECINWMPFAEWPDLVGVGSVCRRQLTGPDGLFEIIDAIDAVLPPHVKLHLFGVKSTALNKLADHPRIASTDSMAWDFGARMERRTGRDMDFRVGHMKKWADGQQKILDDTLAAVELRSVGQQPSQLGLGDAQRYLFPADEFPITDTVHSMALEALTLTYCDLVLSSNLEYEDAVQMTRYDAVVFQAKIALYGVADAARETADEFEGFGDHLNRIADRNGLPPIVLDEDEVPEFGEPVRRDSETVLA